MAKWIVKGVRKDDGQPVALRVEAPTKQDAEARANSRGVLIESVDLEGSLQAEPTAAQRLAAMSGGSVRSSAAQASAGATAHVDPPTSLETVSGVAQPRHPAPTQAMPIQYASHSGGAMLPDYRGLRIASVVLKACAFVYYALSGVVLLVALLMLGASIIAFLGGATQTPMPRNSNPFAQQQTASAVGFLGVIMSAVPLIWALCIFAAGAVFHGLSGASTALRDIARNSWLRT